MEWREGSRPFVLQHSFRRFLIGILLAALILGGWQLRRYTWEATTHLRFQRDLVNGFYWGTRTIKEGRRLSPGDNSDSWLSFTRGYFGLYDQVERESYYGEYHLDYPPLRLLVMSIWTRAVRARFPGVEDGTPDYVQPLLKLNSLCELLTAVAIFLIVRLGVRRASGATDSAFLHRLPVRQRAWICGLIAATLAWFEPSMILDAHGWPQWDVWILPFFLFASLAALTRKWFLCGVLLALGAMFKGQLLLVAPFFVLWPLWQKRWLRALHVTTGFIATFALIASPWLLRNATAWIAVALVGLASLFFLRSRAVRETWVWVAGLTALTTFVLGAVDGGSYAWLKIGFLYGSEHYPYLFISSCYNLPALLAEHNWSLKTPFWSFHLGHLHLAFTLQWSLRLLYLAALALCALATAQQYRHRNPRLLISLATPWLLMFALLPQMHERYLLWGAVVSAAAIGVSLRLTFLHFLFSIMSTAMITDVLLIDKKLDPTLRTIDVLFRIRPWASWILLGCVALYLWNILNLRPSRFRPRERRVYGETEAALAAAAAIKEA